jgi:hypothetical protein
VPVTPPQDAATAPVVRRPAPPPAAPPVAALPKPVVPEGAIYVCFNEREAPPRTTVIEFEPKVYALCRKHPEMGPCQYERNICRRSGGRVFAADGSEITLATEAEYDKRVMRVRFRGD